MKKCLQAVFVLSILLLHGSAWSQKDSTTQNIDSVNATILVDYNRKLAEIELQRAADSVKKAELEIQLKSLKTSENLKKEELEQQLTELRQKESTRVEKKKGEIDSLRATARAFPVVGFFKDTLFLIYSRLGSFSAEERAGAISGRIRKIAGTFRYKLDTLRVEDGEATSEIYYGENIIMSISENDAIWSNQPREELAQKYKNLINKVEQEYKSATSITELAKEIGLALLVLGLLITIIVYIRKLFTWTAVKIRLQENVRIKGISIRNYTLLDSGRQVSFLIWVNNLVKWLVILLSVYIAVPILFGIFPWTRNFADVLIGYILNPIRKMATDFWHFVPNLITIIVIVFVFRYILKAVYFFKTEIENEKLQIPGFYPDWANPTYQIVRVIILAFMVVVIFPYLPGSNSPVFQGVSVFLGFLFTFGSAGSLSNIVAGLVLTYMRLFTIGDRVKIGDVTGDVIEKTLLVTRVRTIKNEIISIPNTTVMNSHAINYSSDAPGKGLIIHSTVTIGYDVPWKDMHQNLIDAALRTELVLPDPTPFVLQLSLDDFYVSYQINAYIREPNKQAKIYSDLHQHIQDVCNERGVEILSPHYRAARDGNNITIPANYLPADYKAPGFKIEMDGNRPPTNDQNS